MVISVKRWVLIINLFDRNFVEKTICLILEHDLRQMIVRIHALFAFLYGIISQVSTEMLCLLKVHFG